MRLILDIYVLCIIMIKTSSDLDGQEFGSIVAKLRVT